MAARRAFLQGSLGLVAWPWLAPLAHGADPAEGDSRASIAGRAEFVFRDEAIRRPFFANVSATPGGERLTRNHPPQQGDAEDHATMHPGVWLAFGDLSGHDFWRNKARVVHEKMSDALVTEKADEGFAGNFTSVHRYESADGKPIARETFVCDIRSLAAHAWRLSWDSTFEPIEAPLVFGDQEEMGLGVRVATRLTVTKGGTILDNQGRHNEKGIWGQTADWCQYAKGGDGVLLMAHPDNFKKSSFHVRDYGLMVANPFAEQAFRRSGKPAQTTVKPGDKLRLRYGLVFFADEAIDPAREYERYVG